MNNLKEMLICFVFSILCACTGINTQGSQDIIFENPERHLGSDTEICGFLVYGSEDHNFYPNKTYKREREIGLGITNGKVSVDKLKRLDGKYTCLKGEIYNRGCGKDLICTDSTHEFALVVNEVAD